MALNDLTGQNIQDTYQKVVQTDGTNLADGTGSLLPISIDGNDVTISGSLTANEYIVSSSVTNITVATLSGSTEFGDSTDDTHTFTGDITASNNISASGTIYANAFRVGPNVPGLAVNTLVTPNALEVGSTSNALHLKGNITASGNISASGEMILNATMSFGAATSKIGREGGDDFIKFSDNDTSICMDSVPVITVNHSGPADGQILINASNQDVDVKITGHGGTNMFHSDAGNKIVHLLDHTTIGPVALSIAQQQESTLSLSGSSNFLGDITSSGTISSSGNIRAGTINI